MSTEKGKRYVFRVEGSGQDISIFADAMAWQDGNKSYKLMRGGEEVGEVPYKTLLGWWIDDVAYTEEQRQRWLADIMDEVEKRGEGADGN